MGNFHLSFWEMNNLLNLKPILFCIIKVYEKLNKNEIALTYKENEQVLNDSLYRQITRKH